VTEQWPGDTFKLHNEYQPMSTVSKTSEKRGVGFIAHSANEAGDIWMKMNVKSSSESASVFGGGDIVVE